MGDTSISWTNKTWNPLRGCSRISKGCMNCYAERTAMRFAGPGGVFEGFVVKRLKVINADEHDEGNRVEARWTGKVELVPEHLSDPLHWAKPCMIFVCSMSDLFHEENDDDTIAAIFGVMAACPQHTFQVLTKRARRMNQWFRWLEDVAKHCNGGVGMHPAAYCFAQAQKRDTIFTLHGKRTPLSKAKAVNDACAAPWPLPNVWLGVSTEDQDAADFRIPELLTTPAAIRWISAEPLLGELGLWAFLKSPMRDAALNKLRPGHSAFGLDWVVAGAESGPRARPCDHRWLRSLRDECRSAGVSFFLKQAKVAQEGDDARIVIHEGARSRRKGGGVIELPYLDGAQHMEWPA